MYAITSEAQKRASKKWNAANMTNLAISVKKSYAEEIKAACKACGTNPGKIMRSAIDQFMDQYKLSLQSPAKPEAIDK